MAHVLFLTFSMPGHLHPMIGMMHCLRQADHQVSWLCNREAPRALQHHIQSFGVQILALPPCPQKALPTMEERVQRFANKTRRLQHLIEMFIASAYIEIEPMRAVIQAVKPDVIALDNMLYGSVIAAHLEQIPYAAIGTNLRLAAPQQFYNTEIEDWEALRPDREALFKQYGLSLDFRIVDVVSPWLNLVFTTEALVGATSHLPPQTFLVGPSLPQTERGDEPDFNFAALPANRPLVYVSFGTIFGFQPDLIRIVAQAAAGLAVQLIVSAGALAHDPSFTSDLPDNVQIAAYVPQLKLLEHAHVFISHGGANSVMEALYHGVPLLLIPLGVDQTLQAHFVEQANAGIVIERHAASVPLVRQSLTQLLNRDSVYHQAVTRIQSSYRARNGAKEAAERIVQLGIWNAQGVRTSDDQVS